MKIRFIQRAAAAVACIGLLLPPSVQAAPATAMKTQGDIALREGGLLVGQVVDARGKALPKIDVAILQGEDEVVRSKTDKNGVFAAKGLRGGEYRVVTGGGQVAYRLWAPKTAPPAASHTALVVTGEPVVNGNLGHGGLVGWVSEHPLLVAAGIATAIAVPIAVADDDDPSS